MTKEKFEQLRKGCPSHYVYCCDHLCQSKTKMDDFGNHLPCTLEQCPFVYWINNVKAEQK